MAKGKKKVTDNNDDDFEVIDKTELEENVKAPPAKGGKKSRKAKKEAELEEAQRELEALNDGDLESEEPLAKPAANNKKAKKGKTKVVESDKEDSEEEVVAEKPKVLSTSIYVVLEHYKTD